MIVSAAAIADLYAFDSGIALTTAQIADRLSTRPDANLIAALEDAEKKKIVRVYKKKFQDPKKWVWIRL